MPLSKDSVAQNSPNKIQNNISNILSVVWPIRLDELPKFFSISALMFCILFIQNVIRAIKDSVVITMIGPESVSFLKVWGVTPTTILYAVIYVKLVNSFKPETLFNIIISSFIAFFIFFALVVFPHSNYIHMSAEYSNSLIQLYPNFKWFILLGANWGYSLFYVVAELWPNAAFAVLFWQFVNSITKVDESKRFYPMFALFSQTSIFFSGTLLVAQSKIGDYLHNSFGIAKSSEIASLQFVMVIVITLALSALAIFKLINTKILDVSANDLIKFNVEKKQKMSVIESFKLALSSKYIMLIAVMLICYGLSTNLVEGPWKKMVSKAYPSTQEYLAFVGSYLRMTGILTISFVLIGSNIIRFFGWYAAAIITPTIMFVTGAVFYYSANFNSDLLTGVCLMIGYDPIMLAIIFGTIQYVVTKSTKYTLFDSTKEMAYVPLEEDLKVRGKAAVDSIGNKIGKSMSAFILSTIFFIFPNATFESISPYLMVIFFIVCAIWLWAVRTLGIEYEKEVKKNEKSLG